MQILVESGNLDQKSKLWSKIKILVKNLNFGQKSKLSSKIKTLAQRKNQKSKMIDLGHQLKCLSKIQILVKYRNLGQISKSFCPGLEFLVQFFGQKLKSWSKSKFVPKIEILVKNGTFCQFNVGQNFSKKFIGPTCDALIIFAVCSVIVFPSPLCMGIVFHVVPFPASVILGKSVPLTSVPFKSRNCCFAGFG